MHRGLLALVIVFAVATLDVRAQMSYGRAPKVAKEPNLPVGLVKVDQKLGGQIPLDLELYDHHGKPIKLADCVDGKPTILVLAYFACPKLCTEVLNGLVYEMQPLTRFNLRAGKQFNVITVSINPKDSPLSARPKRAAYLETYDKRGEDEPGWWFLTASHGQGTNLLEAQEKIKTLSDAVGFHYVADNREAYDQAYAESDETKRKVKLETAIRKTKDYVHPSMVLVMTPQGRISQYFHGLPRSIGGDDLEFGYNAEDLRKALAAANDGRLGSRLTNMAISCYAYDDLSATYKLNMSRLQWVAAPFPFMVLGLVWYARRQALRERLKAKTEKHDGDTAQKAGYVLVPAGQEEVSK